MSVLRKNILSLFVLQGANYLLPLITVPYLVRVLGPQNFGRIAFAQALIQYFVVLTNYSFDLSATRAVSLARDDLNELSRLFSSVMVVKFGIMLLGFPLLLSLVAIFPAFNDNWALYCLVYLTVMGNALFPVWFYQGLERMRHITVFTTIARSLMVIAIFVFVSGPSDYVLAAGLLSGGILFAGLIALIYIPRIARIKLLWPSTDSLRHDIVQGSHIFVAILGGSLYNNSSVFILGLVANPATVGYFAAADKLIKAAQGVIQPVSHAVYPHIAALLAKSRDDALTFIGNLLRIIGGGMFVVSIALFVFAGPISDLLFGDSFTHSITLIELMALVPFLIGLNNVFGAQFLVQFGLGRLLSFSIVLPAIVHIAVLYAVSVTWGAPGVAVLIVFTEAFVLGIRLIGLLRNHNKMLWHVLLAHSP